MEHAKNQIDVATQCTPEKLNNVASEAKPLHATPETSEMHWNLSDGRSTIICSEGMDIVKEKKLRNIEQPVDNEIKLRQMIADLMDILDETIEMFGIPDAGDDDDSDYYIEFDQNGQNVDEYNVIGEVNSGEDNITSDDTEQYCFDSKIESEADSKIETEASNSSLAKEQSEMNPFTETLMIVLMLFSLYFLLSSLI